MAVTALLATTKILLEFANNLFSSPFLAMQDNILIPVKVVLLVLDLAKPAHQLLFVLHAQVLALLLMEMESVLPNVEMALLLETKLVIQVSATHLAAFHVRFKMDIPAVVNLHFVKRVHPLLSQLLHLPPLLLTLLTHQEVVLESIT